MSHKIQITVNDELNNTIRELANKTGLSVSSYARLALINVIGKQNNKLLDNAINDIESGNTETISLEEFNRQLGIL